MSAPTEDPRREEPERPEQELERPGRGLRPLLTVLLALTSTMALLLVLGYVLLPLWWLLALLVGQLLRP